jgi:hypothetical protein
MHVLEPESVIGELRVPIGSVGLLLLLRRAVVLRCDAPSSGDVPAHKTGRGVWSMRLSAVQTCSGSRVPPSAVLPLLWIHSWRNGWNKGLGGDLTGDGDGTGGGGIVDCRDDGGRGPGWYCCWLWALGELRIRPGLLGTKWWLLIHLGRSIRVQVGGV